MTPGSGAATDVARHLWARVAGDTSVPEEVAVVADGTCVQLRRGLGRWIGADGYSVLLDRALGLARAEHPALRGLLCMGEDDAGITASVRAHGAAEVAAGMVALVAALIELLGRIIGDEMAVRLVEEIGIPGPGGVVNTETEGGRDG